jgi:hypothetical protein
VTDFFAGGKKAMGTLLVKVIIIAVVIIIIMLRIHLVVTTGPNPKSHSKNTISAQRPHF